MDLFSSLSKRASKTSLPEDVRHFVTLLCPYSIPSSSLPLFTLSYPIPTLLFPSLPHTTLLPPFPPCPISPLPSLFSLIPSLRTQYLRQSFLLPLPISSFFHSLLQFTPSLTSFLLSTLSLRLSLSPPPPPPIIHRLNTGQYKGTPLSRVRRSGSSLTRSYSSITSSCRMLARSF